VVRVVRGVAGIDLPFCRWVLAFNPRQLVVFDLNTMSVRVGNIEGLPITKRALTTYWPLHDRDITFPKALGEFVEIERFDQDSEMVETGSNV
jgi:hypothetical protein